MRLFQPIVSAESEWCVGWAALRKRCLTVFSTYRREVIISPVQAGYCACFFTSNIAGKRFKPSQRNETFKIYQHKFWYNAMKFGSKSRPNEGWSWHGEAITDSLPSFKWYNLFNIWFIYIKMSATIVTIAEEMPSLQICK